MPRIVNYSLCKEYKNLIFVAIGAVPGSLIRWQINNDFLVNILGAALLGFLLGLASHRNLQLIIGVGFCGSLTTFGSWVFNTFQLLISGLYVEAFGLIFYTFSVGLIAAFFGFWIGQKIRQLRHFQ